MQYKRSEKIQTISMFGLIIAGILIIWGFIIFGQYSILNIGGYILIGIGVIIIIYEFWRYYSRYKFRRKVLIEFEENPSSSISDIVKRTGIKKEALRDIIMDLRGSGEIKGLFSGESGHFETEMVGKEEELEDRYCPQCGSTITQKDQFYCRYCGSKQFQ
jgi:ribosomal protein S27AE